MEIENCFKIVNQYRFEDIEPDIGEKQGYPIASYSQPIAKKNRSLNEITTRMTEYSKLASKAHYLLASYL